MFALPLTVEMINAACALSERLVGWRQSDAAIRAMAKRFPDFDQLSCLVKVVVLNTLYGTNVFAIQRMATHVTTILQGRSDDWRNHALVERIAALEPLPGKALKRHISFASKFAHFYLDSDYFPIIDQYAEASVARHLGRKRYKHDPVHPYLTYVRAIDTLKEEVGFGGSVKALDRYLWLAGEYHVWARKRGKAPINVELKMFFANPPDDLKEQLRLVSGS